MKLVKVTNELKYLGKSRKLAPIEELYMDLKKEELKEAQRMPVIPGIRINDKEKKAIMLVDPMHSVIDIEQPPNIRFCKDTIVQFLKSVDTRVGIPQIARYGIRSTWIHEYEGSFEELLQQCKERVFGNSSVVKNVDDVGVVLDYNKGSGKKSSLTFGPMGTEQLKSQFMNYELEGIAPIFLYTDIDVGDTTTKQFSLEFLNTFFDKAMEEGERISLEIAERVGVKK